MRRGILPGHRPPSGGRRETPLPAASDSARAADRRPQSPASRSPHPRNRPSRKAGRDRNRRGPVLVIEPRMTGLVLLADPPDQEHLRLRIRLAAGPRSAGACPELLFWDRRGLGTVRLLQADQLRKFWSMKNSASMRSDHRGSAANTAQEQQAGDQGRFAGPIVRGRYWQPVRCRDSVPRRSRPTGPLRSLDSIAMGENPECNSPGVGRGDRARREHPQ